MNLLTEAWLPVRRRDGSQAWVTPSDLSDPQIVAFDACRADFNGALAQFAIGLLYTGAPAERIGDWRALYRQPPDTQTLASWFAPHSAAFELMGDGARFMQDFDLRSGDAEPNGIANLLVETAGENTIKNNSDHFIKRDHVQAVCPHCAALALFTLQTNAPAGGAGHRTGLRGGGPLTTLLVATDQASSPASLWQTLWLNMQPRSSWLADGIEAGKEAAHFCFPWLTSVTALQKDGGSTTPVQTHPAHVFWAMPRRIRLDFDTPSSGNCDLCGRASTQLLTHYLTRPQGLNYKGAWRHPLSPYYLNKDELLPLHPQPDGLGYRHWLAWLLGVQNDKRQVTPASVVQNFLQHRIESREGVNLRLWAFGFDFDNMKARCWYESTVPLYGLDECSAAAHKELQVDVGDWLNGAELAASYLRGAVKDAWFSADARGEFGFTDASFWSRSESYFYKLLRERIQVTRAEQTMDRQQFAERWLEQLRKLVMALFDKELVGASTIQRQNPARIAAAHKQLKRNLGGAKLRQALGLPVPDKPKGKAAKPAQAKA